VESCLALLSQLQIKRGSHSRVCELQPAILEFIDADTELPKHFVWTKNADAISTALAGSFPVRWLATPKQ
jgi:hypothetical protein